MSTWTFKRLITGLGLGLALTACDEGGAGFLGTSSDAGRDTSRPDQPLTAVALADGAVAISAPRGYCVDKTSLGSNFAIVARCDSLGVREAFPDTPLGMVVVSVAQTATPLDNLADILGRLAPRNAEPVKVTETDDLALMYLRGGTPEGADPRHWRGLARIGPHLLSLAAFAPPGGALSGGAGGRVIETLVERSLRATRRSGVTAKAQAPDQETPRLSLRSSLD